jgi:hypothetical protein
MDTKKAIKPAPKKLWVVKGNDGVADFKESGDISDIRLRCDCTCPDCKETYNAYLEEKAMVKVLQAQAADNENERRFVIAQVDELELQHKFEREDNAKNVQRLQATVDSLNKSLENERKLRIEEVYKLEFQKKETVRVEGEVAELRKQLMDALNALPDLQLENATLKQRVDLNKNSILQMSAELERYNYELARMEDLNTRLRLRLSEADTKLGKIMVRASPGDLGSGSVYSNAPLPALKSALRSSSSGAAGFAVGGSISSALIPARSMGESFTSSSRLMEALQATPLQSAHRSGKLKQLRYHGT